ncbi:hypothetical protein CEXT_435651, partial [Caerostris extrusa]
MIHIKDQSDLVDTRAAELGIGQANRKTSLSKPNWARQMRRNVLQLGLRKSSSTITTPSLG